MAISKKFMNQYDIEVWDGVQWYWMASGFGIPEGKKDLAKYRKEEPDRIWRMTVKKVPR